MVSIKLAKSVSRWILSPKTTPSITNDDSVFVFEFGNGASISALNAINCIFAGVRWTTSAMTAEL